MKKFGCFIALVLVLVVGIGVFAYPGLKTTANHLNPLRQRRDAAWGEVQNQYQRRADLLPALADTVKAAGLYEEKTFREVAEARASVGKVTIDASKAPESAEQLKQYDQAQGQITGALSHLMSISEAYPQLKANQNFLNLQVSIEGTENRIAVARSDFNSTTMTYDTARNNWPENFYAKYIGFPFLPYFEADKDAQHAPKLNMSDAFQSK